jgi:hypothetical protein
LVITSLSAGAVVPLLVVLPLVEPALSAEGWALGATALTGVPGDEALSDVLPEEPEQPADARSARANSAPIPSRVSRVLMSRSSGRPAIWKNDGRPITAAMGRPITTKRLRWHQAK